MAVPVSEASVLPRKFGGGPHGLGDPDDTSLRKVEIEVLIPKIMRDKAKAENCFEEVQAFNRCCKESSLGMVIKCRKENSMLMDCLGRWYKDEEFQNICKEEYLKQRQAFRSTGLSQKYKKQS